MKTYKFLLIICFTLTVYPVFSQEIQFTKEEKQWIKEHPVIHYGYEPHWEPYEIYKNGKYGGIVGEYVKILSQKTGIKMVPIPNLTWEESMKGLLEGSIMIVPSFVNTKKRRAQFKLTKPYIIDPIVIVGTKNSTYFSTLSDLKGKTVALPDDYYTNTLIKENYPSIKVKNYASVENCLEALITKKVDAFIGNLNVVSYYRNNFGYDDLKIVGLTPFKKNGVCLAVNPQWETFRDIADKVFQSVTPKESHDIRERWIGINNEQYFHSSFFRWTLFIFVTVFLVLLVIFLRNRALKKGIRRGRKIEKDLYLQLSISEKTTKEKQAMLREIHHRIKNNLQTISSMLNLQAHSIKSEPCKVVLNNAAERVNSIALIHNKIYESETIKFINLKEYILSLFQAIQSSYTIYSTVQIDIEAEELDMEMKSVIPLALILNELLSNSLKYAFKKQDEPKISIYIQANIANNKIEMTYSDNGVWIENAESDLFGTSLINTFTEQIGGTYQLTKEPHHTTYHFVFSDVELNA